jgi:hypothetical protein
MKHKTKHRSKKLKKSKKSMKKYGGYNEDDEECEMTSDPEQNEECEIKRERMINKKIHKVNETYGIPEDVLHEASMAASKVIYEFLEKHDKHDEIKGAFAPLLIPLAMKFGPAAFNAAKKYGPGLMSKYGPGMLKKAEGFMNKKA